jgi:syntaxin-binding protein 1
MLGGIQDSTGGGWKVLVLDSTTTRILSAAMRMSDILEAGGQQQT